VSAKLLTLLADSDSAISTYWLKHIRIWKLSNLAYGIHFLSSWSRILPDSEKKSRQIRYGSTTTSVRWRMFCILSPSVAVWCRAEQYMTGFCLTAVLVSNSSWFGVLSQTPSTTSWPETAEPSGEPDRRIETCRLWCVSLSLVLTLEDVNETVCA